MNPRIVTLPKSALRVLRHLDARGRTTSQELQRELSIARRTVYASLRRLIEHQYVRAIPNFRDMRQAFYEPVAP